MTPHTRPHSTIGDIGLAIPLVSVGAAATLSVRYASQRSSWFNAAALRAPYLSGGLIALVGLYVGLHGWWGVQALSS